MVRGFFYALNLMAAELNEKAQILDQAGIQRAVTRIAHEIVERNKGTHALGLIGVRSRGGGRARHVPVVGAPPPRRRPIRAAYVGTNLPTSRQEQVQVLLTAEDGVDGVLIVKG